jgi:hypothetical protein
MSLKTELTKCKTCDEQIDRAEHDCDYCEDCCHELQMSWNKTDQDSISWGELAELTHATQVERFGWCSCEDMEPHEYPYLDCIKTQL